MGTVCTIVYICTLYACVRTHACIWYYMYMDTRDQSIIRVHMYTYVYT